MGAFLRGLSLPKFSRGGATSSFSIPDFSPAVAAASGALRGNVDITLRSGREKVSLFGERQQVDKFVSMLKKMEVGV